MIEKDERESIINEAIERILRYLPEAVGNLMASNAMYTKLTTDFYKDHSEFKNHKEIVKEVVGKIEGQNPTKDYKDILKEAIPVIRDQIKLKSGVSMGRVDKGYLKLDIPSVDNGEI